MTCELEADTVLVVRLPAEIDLTNREQACDRLCAALARGAAVVIADLTATRSCDCGSWRRLTAVQHQAAARRSQLRLVLPPGSPVRRLADLTDLDGQPPLYSSVREATAWLPHPGGSPRVS